MQATIAEAGASRDSLKRIDAAGRSGLAPQYENTFEGVRARTSLPYANAHDARTANVVRRPHGARRGRREAK